MRLNPPPPATARQLQRLAAELREGAPLTPDEAEIVAEALDALLAGEAFKVAPGQRRPATVAAIEERNELLRQAAARFFPGAFPSQAARHLAEVLRRYAASAWPRERHLDVCPERHIGTVAETAWHVLKVRDYVLSERAIRAAISGSELGLFVARHSGDGEDGPSGDAHELGGEHPHR